MFRTLRLSPISLQHNGYVPPLVQPLLDAAQKGEDLVPIVESITRGFGFDTFNCGVCMNRWPIGEGVFYVFTTMPVEWVAIYDQRSYIEVDPRVQTLLQTLLPIVWDQKTFRGKSGKLDEFLASGFKYGLGSGVAVGFFDARGHAVMVALNSKAAETDAARTAEIFRDIPNIMIFAHFFHEMLFAAIIERSIPPRSQGAPISPRERECLNLAARGQTGDDIGIKLGISARTVQFHFDSIRSKLGAMNRQEAIAKATREGLITDN